MRRVTRAAASAALGLALTAVSGVATATPSVASSPLTISYTYCEQVFITWPPGLLFCSANVSGGVAPYTYVWTPPPNPDGQSPVFGNDAYVPCTPGDRAATVRLRVTDSVGQTADSYAWNRCLGPGEQLD